jgi:predicted transcriptional regulator
MKPLSNEEEFRRGVVLGIIEKSRSMSFLELASVSRIDQERLRTTLDGLEKLGLVTVVGREDVFGEYVKIKRAP